jgi:outer membrane protein assembly factor BamB
MPNPQPAAPAPAEESRSIATPERVCLWPGWITWVLWFASAGIIYWLRTNREQLLEVKFFDSAVINLLTTLCVLVSFLSFWAWFVFRSTHSIMVRKVVYVLSIVLVIFMVTCLRFEGFTGNMIPTGIRFAWDAPRDYQRERPQVNTTPKVVKKTTEPSEEEETGADKALAKLNEKETPETTNTTPPANSTATSNTTAPSTTPLDFPQFLGPQRNGYVPNIELATDWQVKPPHEEWRVEVGAGWSAFVVVGNRAVTMEQYGDMELITCRDLDSGDLIWSHEEQARHHETLGGIGPRATPTIHEDKVYSVGATGIVTCLQFSDGKLLWRDDLRKRYAVEATKKDLFGNVLVEDENQVKWGRSGSPLIFGDLCILPAGGKYDPAKNRTPKSLIAFDKLTGEVKWEGGDTQIGYASPTAGKLLGRDQILSVNEDNVTGHDPTTGTVLWSIEWEGQSNAGASCSQPHIVGDDLVFVSKGYSKGAALFRLLPKPRTVAAKLDAATGQTLRPERTEEFTPEAVWDDKRLLKTKFTNVVIIGDYVYGLNDGILECVEWKSGKSQWKKGRYGHGQILGVGNVILVLTEKSGEIVMVAAEPQAYREYSRFQALSSRSQAWNNLCLVGKKLLVRNADEAARFDLP